MLPFVDCLLFISFSAVVSQLLILFPTHPTSRQDRLRQRRFHSLCSIISSCSHFSTLDHPFSPEGHQVYQYRDLASHSSDFRQHPSS